MGNNKKKKLYRILQPKQLDQLPLSYIFLCNFITYKHKNLYGLRIKYIDFIDYEKLATMIKNLQRYKNKNGLRMFEAENWLRNKNAEPHFKQGRILAKTVADSWAGAVMRKPLAILQYFLPTYRPTDTASSRVACPRLKTVILFKIQRVLMAPLTGTADTLPATLLTSPPPTLLSRKRFLVVDT